MGVGVCGVVPCNRFHLPNFDVSELPQQKKQTKYYYATAIASIVSCVFLTAFNYNTTVTIFWAPLKLMGIQDGFVVDLGITVLALRVIVEYGIFIFHAVREKQKAGSPRVKKPNTKNACLFRRLSPSSLCLST